MAWFRNLGGIPFEPEITRVVNANRQAFVDLGCVVEEAEPDFAGVDEAFPILRHLSYHASYAKLARENPAMFKDTVKWEIAEAERNTGADVGRARGAAGTRCRATSRSSSSSTTTSCCPVTQVEPFDLTDRVSDDGQRRAMPTYIDWMRSCWYVTFMACPAISRAGRIQRERAAGGTADRRQAAAATGACCRWRTRSSRRRVTGRAGPPSDTRGRPPG